MVLGLNSGTTNRYNSKETTRTVLGKVLGSVTGTTDSYGSKEPTRMVRKSVLGSFTTKTELCGRNSRGPTSTVIRSNRS